MVGVFYCDPTNSTHFTECCRVAICDDQLKCPKCKQYIYPCEDPDTTDDPFYKEPSQTTILRDRDYYATRRGY